MDLSDTDVWVERPELTDDDGEDDRGVDASELSELFGDAIGKDVEGEERKEEQEETEEGGAKEVAAAAAAAATVDVAADEEKDTEEAG